MSKVGKQPVQIPSGVTVSVNGQSVHVKGSKGEFTRQVPGGLTVELKDNAVHIGLSPAVQGTKDEKKNRALWGLYRALISNCVIGASQGFETVLEFEGVGYKAAVQGKDLVLNLGYSHPITVKAPEGITFSTEKNSIKISGADKELIGHVAYEIRSHRFPEPYQGSGIRYKGEVIRRKAGKKAATAA